ncbi:Polyadenylate-binding protein 1 [Camellia lanceoleosa]|uniref:Polyadenylate-binding protein 1 n=1 Tax=Camellia lanceoleosa TaxID=1840588 RepID=A0ACC0J3N0_9ERIC|nr:Polyadenylate-binding protein 1 [Camellia lanceoleosa]
MKKRLKEIEEEAGALREMQFKVEKEMGAVQDSSSPATQAEKEEVDSRSIYVGNSSNAVVYLWKMLNSTFVIALRMIKRHT